MYLCKYVCIYMYIRIYIYLFMYSERERGLSYIHIIAYVLVHLLRCDVNLSLIVMLVWISGNCFLRFGLDKSFNTLIFLCI